jgi:hypothetical protein
MVRMLIGVVFLTLSFSTTSAEDAIKSELDKSRAIYSEQIETAKQTFLSAAEAKLKEHAEKGDFDNAKEIKDQKDGFAKDGKLPSSGKLLSARRKYEAEVDGAKAAFQKALEAAKSEYTKRQMISDAEAIDVELKALTSKVKREYLAVDLDSTSDLLQEGTIWKGYRTFPRGRKVPYELQITFRDRNQFRGIAIGGKAN